MDQDVIGWSTADVTLLIQSLAQPAIEQFVHDHPLLQQRALAGFSKRLPPNYAQRLANYLAQRAVLYQQNLQELIKCWRQEKQSLCEAIEQMEAPITLEALAPLLQQHGGRDILSALHTDPRAESFGEILAALRQGIERGEIPLKGAPAPVPTQPARGAGKLTLPSVPAGQAQGAATGPANRRAPSVATATLARPSGRLPHPAAALSTPKTTVELFAALEAELQALQSIQQTIETCGAQLTQHQTSDDPQALQRIIERLNASMQKRKEGFARFAALDSELLKALRAQTQQAEAAGQVEGLSASLPADTTPGAISEASARLQAFHQVSERLTAALTLNEQHLAALKAAPAAIEALLREIEELDGESGPLRARLANLKITVPENATTRQVERALQVAERVREQALTLRNGLLEDWNTYLLRACRDSESLLNQSLHLSADLPEITNLQQSLQQARTVLATPLVPNPPVPLPFPPKKIIACRQQLNQHSDRLRRTLTTYNPQIALAFLQEFEEQAGPVAELTPQQLQKVGAALVGAASLRTGYSGLIWRVGATLLAALDNATAEQFYERFGFAAVATAIAISLRNGDFPLGLGFAEKEYLFYTDAEVGSVFKHERVLDILSYNCGAYTFPALPADCFANAAPAVRQAARELFASAEQINFPAALGLQLSAALLAAAASPEERAQAGQLLIRSLIRQRQHVNAYCVWRALVMEQPNLYSNATGLEALFSLIWHFTLDTHTPTAPLAALCSDASLQEASSYVPGIALALTLGALALARARHPRGEEWSVFFLDVLRDHHHYLALSDALRARLPKPSGDMIDGEDAEALGKQQAILAQFNAALAEAERRLQVSNYRFAPTKQMRNQIDAQIQPALASLQQGLEPPGLLGADLREADPVELTSALIQEAEKIRRQEGHGPIEGNDLKKLRKDLEHVLKQVIDADGKRAELAALGVNVAALCAEHGNEADAASPDQPGNLPGDFPSWENHEALQSELRRLLTDAPGARDLLQQALPDISLEVG